MKKILAAALLSLLASPVALAGPAETFQAKCAACHGKDGKGQSDMAKKLGVKDLTVTKLPAAEIEKVVANGKGKMTPWKGKLSDAEISALAKFVASGLK
jgi:mono/diheme cytochrome c family protein